MKKSEPRQALTLQQKQALIRKFMKDMQPYVLSSAYALPDDATIEDAQEIVADRFSSYLNPQPTKLGKKKPRAKFRTKEIA